MTRVFGHYISVEMTLLWVVELFLSFILIYLMLLSTGVAGGNAGLVQPEIVNLAATLAVTIGGTATVIGLYRPEICLAQRRLVVSGIVAGLLAFPAVIAVSQVLQVTLSHFYLLGLAKLLIAWFACLLASRWLFGWAVRQNMFSRRVLVVGDGQRAAAMRDVLRHSPGRFIELAGTLSRADLAHDDADPRGTLRAGDGAPHTAASDPLSLEKLKSSGIWGIVVADGDPERLPVADMIRVKMHGIRVFADLDFWERHLGRINLDQLNKEWFLFADGFTASRLDGAARRLLDIVASVTLLLLTLPLMIAVAVLIKLDSPGGVFYRQARVGMRGQTFTLFKFRSMRSDAESAGRPAWATQNDPRVTRVGALIRLTRIDELPQLLNVLRGEMSFVGPRPERPHFVEQLSRAIPFYAERHFVKPGITGWAQINYPYGASVEDAREKLSYDLYYVKNRSLFLDILILISTVRVILFQEGAR